MESSSVCCSFCFGMNSWAYFGRIGFKENSEMDEHVIMIAGVDVRNVDKHSAISHYDWKLVDKFYHENGW